MNILYLANHLNVGGVTSYILTLASGFTKQGHTVYVASSGGQMVDAFEKAGARFIRIPIKTKAELHPKVLASFFYLLNRHRRYRFDIVHVNTRVTQVLGQLLRSYARLPFVWTCHGYFLRKVSHVLSPCWGDRVIAISKEVQEHLTCDFKMDVRRIRLIHNGIDVEKFRDAAYFLRAQDREDLKRRLGLHAGPVVGIIARLSDVKGHRYLIAAMKDVIAVHPAAQLLIVGEGREKVSLVRLVSELGITGNIVFHEQAPYTPEVLAAMDIFVLPSLQEGLGLALMEAMAFGLPVIGSDVGGIRTLIKDGERGLRVPAHDSKALAHAILNLLQNPEACRLFGQQASTFVAENFSQEKMRSETEKVYQECLNG
ncbi:MAG TPA: glycosyltransferase family 4 protein [Candidatus Omnitrophota bacterium]|nr:glycosyltransferase family 4 protein [Candidatus Omnitrophota bacterium]